MESHLLALYYANKLSIVLFFNYFISSLRPNVQTLGEHLAFGRHTFTLDHKQH